MMHKLCSWGPPERQKSWQQCLLPALPSSPRVLPMDSDEAGYEEGHHIVVLAHLRQLSGAGAAGMTVQDLVCLDCAWPPQWGHVVGLTR